MKKILGLVMGFVMVASVAFAEAPEKKIELGISGGLGLSTTAGMDLGFGGQVTGLYRVDESLGLGLGIGFDTFSATGSTSTFGASSADLSFLALIKYAIGTNATKPYLIGGAGLSSFISSVTIASTSLSVSSMYPEICGGAGVQFPLGENANLFLQGTANLVLSTGSTFTYIPVDLGVNFNL